MTVRGRVASCTLVALSLALAPLVGLAQQPIAPAAPPSPYRVALTVSAAVGKAGWATEFAGISELAARVRVLPSLGVGLSYWWMNTANNENYEPFRLNAVEGSAVWRPVVGKWFDPFVQAGAVGVVASSGYTTEATSRFGLEGMAGCDFVLLRVAVGVHARSGFTNRAWTMAGLHLELRI